MQRIVQSSMLVLAIAALGCGGFGSPKHTVVESPTVGLRGPCLGQDPPGAAPVVFAPGIVSTGGQELSITFSPDGKELFFCATGPTYRPRFIFHSRLEGGVWTVPREAPFSDPGHQLQSALRQSQPVVERFQTPLDFGARDDLVRQ